MGSCTLPTQYWWHAMGLEMSAAPLLSGDNTQVAALVQPAPPPHALDRQRDYVRWPPTRVQDRCPP
eukprot:556251-Amphidinium_carterae.2